jgi:hypothetical protein
MEGNTFARFFEVALRKPATSKRRTEHARVSPQDRFPGWPDWESQATPAGCTSGKPDGTLAGRQAILSDVEQASPAEQE